jgi:hypothetical protein
MSPDTLPIYAVATFLFIAGVYHLVAHVNSERLLSRVGPVRVVGAILFLLGGWCLLFPTIGSYLVGLPTVLSGVLRLALPIRMIAINTWTSRHVHGVLMLMGAAACVLVAHRLTAVPSRATLRLPGTLIAAPNPRLSCQPPMSASLIGRACQGSLSLFGVDGWVIACVGHASLRSRLGYCRHAAGIGQTEWRATLLGAL